MTELVDAVVIGAGPNGLAAGDVLTDAGWDVVVLEAQDAPGGAVRTGELTEPGFHHGAAGTNAALAATKPPRRVVSAAVWTLSSPWRSRTAARRDA